MAATTIFVGFQIVVWVSGLNFGTETCYGRPIHLQVSYLRIEMLNFEKEFLPTIQWKLLKFSLVSQTPPLIIGRAWSLACKTNQIIILEWLPFQYELK